MMRASTSVAVIICLGLAGSVSATASTLDNLPDNACKALPGTVVGTVENSLIVDQLLADN
jgi:hypothetical protein